jgi:transcriptional regulator with XRE-family HTH domain
MSSLNNRIRDLIQDKNLSPSHFADEIGVQRSSISHILSGRNRPSLEIVQKIVRRFPDLSYESLLDDVLTTATAPPARKNQSGEGGGVTGRSDRRELNGSKSEKKAPRARGAVKTLRLSEESTPMDEKEKKTRVVKITLFYEDNTFQEFEPNG